MFPPRFSFEESKEDNTPVWAISLQAANDKRLGFTLMELLVVLFLVAACLGSVTFLYREPSAGAKLKTAAIHMASRLRDLRVAAMSTHSERVAVIDTRRRSMRFSDRRAPLRLPRSLSIRVTAAESETRPPSAAGIRFFPNGSSSGGTIVLGSQRQRYEVRVHWLTGRVATTRLP